MLKRIVSGTELLLVLGLGLVQIWIFPRHHVLGYTAFAIMLAGWIVRKEGPRKLGLIDFRLVIAVSLIFLGKALIKNFSNSQEGVKRLALVLLAYFGWAVLQQLFLNGFCMARSEEAGMSRTWIPLAAGFIFAAMHIPNPLLVAFTFAGGVAASWIFLHMERKNLYAIALAHAVAGTAILYLLPEAWTHHLVIGPRFWHVL